MDVEAARSPARLAGWLWFVTVFAALAYAGRFAGGGDVIEEPLYEWATAVLGVVQFAIVLGIVFWIAIRASKRELLGLRRPTSWPAAVGYSVLIYVVMLAVSFGISRFLDPSEEQGLVPETWPPPSFAAFAANAFVVVVVAPIVEELTFRGLGFSLLARFGTRVAVGGTALAFALAHGLVEAFPQIFLLGIGLAVLRARLLSVYPCILLHASFNALALTFAAVEAGRG